MFTFKFTPIAAFAVGQEGDHILYNGVMSVEIDKKLIECDAYDEGNKVDDGQDIIQYIKENKSRWVKILLSRESVFSNIKSCDRFEITLRIDWKNKSCMFTNLKVINNSQPYLNLARLAEEADYYTKGFQLALDAMWEKRLSEKEIEEIMSKHFGKDFDNDLK